MKAALTSARLGPGTTLLLSPAWSGHLLPLLRRRSYSLTVTSPILVNESNYTFTSRDSSLHLMPNSSHPLALLISSHLTKIAFSFIYPGPRTGAHYGVGNDIIFFYRHVMRLRTVKTLTVASVRNCKGDTSAFQPSIISAIRESIRNGIVQVDKKSIRRAQSRKPF